MKFVVGKSMLSCILFDCTSLCLYSQLGSVQSTWCHKTSVVLGRFQTSLQLLLEIKTEIEVEILIVVITKLVSRT